MPAQAEARAKGDAKIITHNEITISNKNLYRAWILLEQNGYTVNFAPPELWAHRCLLTAYHPETLEGFLIASDELGNLLHFGMSYLNLHGYAEPRYRDQSNPDRLRHYAEAVVARACTEVANSQPGSRNSALYRASFVIGRYLLGWQLDPDSVQAQLLDAALQSGIRGGFREAQATIKSGLNDGQKKPRDPSELLSQSDSSQWGKANPWDKPSPWGR